MTLETRLETTVQDGFTWLEERTLSFIRFILFILSLPQRVLPTLLHVAAFTTILPPLLAVSLIAGFTVVNMIPQGWDVNLWMQYGEQATPYARTALPPLVPGQSYDIYLSLDVPITSDNLALGNFMTKLILTDARNTTVATANRPALVFKDKSGWVPFITSSSNIETISIPLVESWSPVLGAGILSNTGLAVARGSTQKGYHAFIAVGRPDSWTSLGNGQGRELSIARAALHGRANISGIRGFFARHKLLLFTLTSTAFFAASAGAALALYVIFAPDLSGGTGSEKSPETLLQGRDTRTIRRTRVGEIKEEETEPPSASESDYTYTSGGIGSIGAESGDERLIFPGVGAFHSAITHLTESGLLEPLKAYIASGKPYFGICIGMQVLFESSTENPSTKGLGIIPAQIEEFGRADKAVPHMGWNIAELVDENPQDEEQTGISRDASFYFVHSFRAAYDGTSAASDWAHATTQYGQELFLSTVRKGNVFATQFHPEKSGEAGLNVLKSWLSAPTEAVDGRGKLPSKRTVRTPRPKDRFIKRVIACMDVRANDEGDLVVTKGDQYDVREKETSPKAQVVVQSSSRPSSPSRAVRNLGKPVALAKAYYDAGADEICLLNITSFRNSPLVDQPMLAVVRAAAAETFVPLTIGGGIKDTVDPDGTPRTALEVAGAYFRAGADKVSIGSEAVVAVEAMLARPGQTLGGTSPMETISHVYGRQAVVVSIDPRKVYVTDPTDHADELVIGKEAISAKEDEKDKMWWYQATTQGGRTNRPLSVVQLAKGAERLGAGEILLNSIDRDGTNIGYDLDLINLVKKAVNIPVVASSGAGKPADFVEVFEKTGVEAALAAGIFHRKEVRIPDVKAALEGAQINVRK